MPEVMAGAAALVLQDGRARVALEPVVLAERAVPPVLEREDRAATVPREAVGRLARAMEWTEAKKMPTGRTMARRTRRTMARWTCRLMARLTCRLMARPTPRVRTTSLSTVKILTPAGTALRST